MLWWCDRRIPLLLGEHQQAVPCLCCRPVLQYARHESPAAVLNDYDQETQDFYEWEVRISKAKVKSLLMEKLHLDLGNIVAMEPLERGKSGRISRLKVIGTERSFTIGKELEIRRALSDTHLYSSAFTVTDEGEDFLLKGKGWGHGVGLCQIGAAVMGEKGFKYDEILLHYYKNAEIKKIYR